MADKREIATRAGMIFLAALFVITSVGLSIFVIIQAKQQNDAEKKAAASQTATDDSTNTTPKEGALQGTQLTGFTPTDTPVTELQIIDTVPGTGDEVKEGATITAHYTGALVKTGVIFQSSHDTGQPFTSALSGLIVGWQKGIPGMKVGGTRRLIIPAAQAYGAASQEGIPANSDLVFDIELVSVQQ
jgi:FKBP-type peptidyl-prolyl cis-trans isomerase